MPDLMFVAYQFNERSSHSKVVSSGLGRALFQELIIIKNNFLRQNLELILTSWYVHLRQSFFLLPKSLIFFLSVPRFITQSVNHYFFFSPLF